MDDSDKCGEEEGGKIKCRAQGRAIAGQYHRVGQNPISWLARGREWSGEGTLCVWVAFARGRVLGWGCCRFWLLERASTVIRALWTRD